MVSLRLSPQRVGLGAETREPPCGGQRSTQGSVCLAAALINEAATAQKTGRASGGEFTGPAFFNGVGKSSSHKPWGLNWNAPGLGRGRGISRGMRAANGENWREGGGVCNAAKSLPIRWEQVVMNGFLSSVGLAEKCHAVFQVRQLVTYLT